MPNKENEQFNLPFVLKGKGGSLKITINNKKPIFFEEIEEKDYTDEQKKILNDILNICKNSNIIKISTK